jgi:hypothetical protein
MQLSFAFYKRENDKDLFYLYMKLNEHPLW